MSSASSNYLLTGLTLPDGTVSDIQIVDGVIAALGNSRPNSWALKQLISLVVLHFLV